MSNLTRNGILSVKAIFGWIILLTLVCSSVKTFSQCGAGVPVFIADLTQTTNNYWISPDTFRNGNCCGTSAPDKCIKFIVTLPPRAEGIIFDIYSGAVPSGSMYYQVNCGPQTSVGDSLCLSGSGPYIVTFCKPGNNQNRYIIRAFPTPDASGDIAVNEGCTGTIFASGYALSSISWTTIYPGSIGAYNSYLSCTSGCDTVQIQAQVGYPSYIDVKVCGYPMGSCSNASTCDTVRVYFNSTLFANIQPDTPTVCYGSPGTTITAYGIGGTPPYNYHWSTSDTSQSIFVNTGTYIVQLGDTSGCPPTWDTIVVTGFPSPISANAGPNRIICGPVQLQGQVVAASGGKWVGGSGTFTPSRNALSVTYTPTAAEFVTGTVNLMLITTGNGSCPADTDFLKLTLRTFSDTFTLEKDDITCFGFNDGEIFVDITTHYAPFSFLWSNSDTSQKIEDLAPGQYTVVVTDSNGCQATDSVIILEPDSLVVTSVITNALCYNENQGSITLTVTGGSPAYSFLWSNLMATQNLSSLVSDSYTVVVTDSIGCQVFDTFFITEPPLLTATLASDSASCFGGTDGSIDLTPSGGTLPYTYLWSNFQSTQDISGLATGWYYITLSDSNNCVYNDSALVNQPTILFDSLDYTEPKCYNGNDGSINLYIYGGTQPYSFLWSNLSAVQNPTNLTVGQYVVVITDSKGCILTDSITVTQPTQLTDTVFSDSTKCYGSANGIAYSNASGGTLPYSFLWSTTDTTQNISGLTAGNYIITITDDNGCVVTDSIMVYQPDTLTVTAINKNVTCFNQTDGTSSLSVSGGTAPYYFSWSTGDSTANAVNLGAGNYFVYVTDANACLKTVPVSITQPNALAISNSFVNPTCFSGSDGSIDLTVTGGTLPYWYSWSNMAITQDISGLKSGTYSVQVADSHGCTIADTITLTDPLPIIVNALIKNVCIGGNDGTITITVTNGTAPYQFLWSNSATTQNLTNLAKGTYTLMITDSKGCQHFDTFTVQEAPVPLSDSLVKKDISCFGMTDGTITYSVSGGSAPYSFIWSNSSTNQNQTGLSSGKYVVTITDNLGCKLKDSAIIIEPTPLVNSFTPTNIQCYGGTNGSIISNVSGGTPPYTWNWSNSQTTQSISGLSKGKYLLTITDSNSCIKKDSVVLTEPPKLNVASLVRDVNCNGGSDGSVSLTISGGTPPFTYQWSTGATTKNIALLKAGTYSVIIRELNNCLTLDTFTIKEPAPLSISYSKTNEKCDGDKNGQINVNVTGGVLPYTFNWSNGATTQNISALSKGSYWLTVTDSHGCTKFSDTIPISAFSLPVPHVQPDQDIRICLNDSVEVTVVESYKSYLWSNGKTSQSFWIKKGGNFSATVTDSNGCKATTSILSIDVLNLRLLIKLKDLEYFCPDSGGIVLRPGKFMEGTYYWMPGNIHSVDNYVNHAGVYVFTLSVGNCTVSDSVLVEELCPPLVHIPNAFTPNGDDLNDLFGFSTLYVDTFHYIIFDRWGEILYRSSSMTDWWDFKFKNETVPLGTYCYVIWYANRRFGNKIKYGTFEVIR